MGFTFCLFAYFVYSQENKKLGGKEGEEGCRKSKGRRVNIIKIYCMGLGGGGPCL